MSTRIVGMMSTLTLAALMVLAPLAQGQDIWENEFNVEPGQKIELEMDRGGSLEVEGWDRDLVRIVCSDRSNDIEDYDIEVKETGNGLHLKADLDSRRHPNNSLVVKVQVPHTFDIETSSGGGHISITGVTGDFRGRSGGGGITLQSVSGEARLTTGGGRIKILDSDLDGRVSSGGGGGLVRNVTGNVKASSGGGAIIYENVRDRRGELRGPGRTKVDGMTARTVIYTSAGGGIDLDEAPEGAVVSTGGGDIDIRDASRFVKARTGGGDIEIEIVNGHVDASTGAGDIEVIVQEGFGDSGDGIDLRTGHGEVTLIVPADASLELDLDLSYTRNSSRDFEIDCDFDVDVEETRNWDKQHGTPRKHIYGTGIINGGKHRVNIRNTNGNIRIKTR